MSTITILGLGPGDYDDLTVGALRTLRRRATLILRTDRHPCVPEILARLSPDCRVQSCDDLYTEHAEFDAVYHAVVSRVLAASAHGDVVYAVPGHPWVGEATTPMLIDQARTQGIEHTRSRRPELCRT